MTMLALQNSSIDDITKRQVARYAQMPDFAKTELGYHNNTHFFFPNSKKKSFGPDSDKLNAFSQFKEHLQQAMLSEAKEEVLKKTRLCTALFARYVCSASYRTGRINT